MAVSIFILPQTDADDRRQNITGFKVNGVKNRFKVYGVRSKEVTKRQRYKVPKIALGYLIKVAISS